MLNAKNFGKFAVVLWHALFWRSKMVLEKEFSFLLLAIKQEAYGLLFIVSVEAGIYPTYRVYTKIEDIFWVVVPEQEYVKVIVEGQEDEQLINPDSYVRIIGSKAMLCNLLHGLGFATIA